MGADSITTSTDETTRPFFYILDSTHNENDNDSKQTHQNDQHQRYPIYFSENWDTGIGGGLWSTGLAMAHYFAHHRHSLTRCLIQLQKRRMSRADCKNIHLPMRALELGSGNGFLSVCLLASLAAAQAEIKAYSQQQQQQQPQHHQQKTNDGENDNRDAATILDELVITDNGPHLPLIEKTLTSNRHIVPSFTMIPPPTSSSSSSSIPDPTTNEDATINKDMDANTHTTTPSSSTISTNTPTASTCKVTIQEHIWGQPFTHHHQNSTNTNTTPTTTTTTTSPTTITHTHSQKFDFVFGSDLAYRPELHHPLLTSLSTLSHEDSVIILGVTMNDTPPSFFQQGLDRFGFVYERLASHLVVEERMRGEHFGLFVIQKKKKTIK